MPLTPDQKAALVAAWQTYTDEDPDLALNPLEHPIDPSLLAWPGEDNVTGRAIVRPARVAGGQVVNVLEPRDGALAWWLKTSDFGGRFIGELPVVGTEIQIGNLERAPGPTRPIAITLFRSDRDVSTEGNTDVYAKIVYGAGGAQNTFLCDWTQGGSLCIPATNVRVTAVVYAPAEGEIDSPTTGITLGVTFGLGAVTPSRPPTFTTSLPTLGTTEPSSVFAFDVPDFARRAFPLIPNDGADLDDFFFELYTGNGIATVSRRLTQEILLQGVPVPGATTHGKIQNLTGAPQRVGMMFELGL